MSDTENRDRLKQAVSLALDRQSKKLGVPKEPMPKIPPLRELLELPAVPKPTKTKTSKELRTKGDAFNKHRSLGYIMANMKK